MAGHAETEQAHEASSTKFVGGVLPPVGGGGRAGGASASDAAFGKKDRDSLISVVASSMHEQWRAPRKNAATGTFEPRVKKTKDEAWSKAHGGATEVDIANTSYKDLPDDWQAENEASAIVAVDLVLAASKSGGRLDAAFVEKASAAIHVKWLERNGSWAPPEQKLPYGSLSEPEKEKDRVVVRAAIRAFTT